MKCPGCQFENPAAMKFCVECGVRLLVRCTQCDTEMLPTYKFCGECGAGLEAGGAEPRRRPAPARSIPAHPAPAPRAAVEPRPASDSAGGPPQVAVEEGERKQVSVLVCSLVVPVEAEKPLTADQQHSLLNRFFELAQPEIERFGGTISRFLNQGFMALFGAPIAWEDHPHRAVLAALALMDRVVGQVARQQGVGYALRIGIDTGAVVVGGVGGMAVGEATTRARAFEQQAQAGDILIGRRTGRSVQGLVALEGGEAVLVEGKTVESLRVRSGDETRAASSYPVGEAGLSPFVGRHHELSVLEQLRDLAGNEQGQVLGLVGEAGSGKSRLLHEFYQRTQPGKDVSYLRGQCLSYGGGVPYLPLIDMIKKASQISERDDTETMVEKMRGSLERVGTDMESLPYFLRLLGVEQGTEALAGLEPQAIQARTFAAMRRMLLDAGRHALVVLEIEDLHWIDETSAEFLDSLVEIMAAARLLVVLTYRSGYQPRWLEKSFATQLSVRRLTEDDSRRLVSSLLERSDQALELDETLLAKAEGNPLFLEELTRSLIDSSEGGEAVPDTIQGILMARIDGLPQKQRRLLRTASVLGRMMNHELLEVIWDDPDPMDALLEDLQRWELIYKAPSEDQVSYVFKHALTQEVAYESLLSDRRQELHLRAARALEEHHGEHLEEVYHQLIHHYPRAGEPGKAVHYLTLFAERAARNNAHTEAAKALREALQHVERIAPEERERRLVEVLLQLADSLLPLAAFPETLELFEGHLTRLEELDEPALKGRYYFWLAHTHTYLGHQEATREYAERAIVEAKEAADEATEGKVCYVLGRDGFWSGQFSDGIRNSLRAVVLLERTGEVWWQGQAYWVAGFNHYALGQFEQAIEALERCCAIGEALDDYRLDASWSLGYFYTSLGEAEKGIEFCQQGLERSQDPLNSAVSTGFLGHAELLQGDYLEQAITNLRSAVERMRQAGMQQLEGWFSVFLGEGLLATEALEEAREMSLSALELGRAAGFLYGQGLARHTLGRISLAAADFAEAENNLEEAKALFEELGVPFEVGRICLDQARLARGRELPAVAADHLQEALLGFENLEVPGFIRLARGLEAELG